MLVPVRTSVDLHWHNEAMALMKGYRSKRQPAHFLQCSTNPHQLSVDIILFFFFFFGGGGKVIFSLYMFVHLLSFINHRGPFKV